MHHICQNYNPFIVWQSLKKSFLLHTCINCQNIIISAMLNSAQYRTKCSTSWRDELYWYVSILVNILLYFNSIVFWTSIPYKSTWCVHHLNAILFVLMFVKPNLNRTETRNLRNVQGVEWHASRCTQTLMHGGLEDSRAICCRAKVQQNKI
jgi:hypothetical protein